MLEEYSKIDKRIVIVKNKQNKGTFYGYIRGALEVKANHLMIIDQDDMLLSNLKELIEVSEQNNKDINDFSYLEEQKNNLTETILDAYELLVQPTIEELVLTGKYNKDKGFYITKKILKSEFFKDVVKRIKEEYLNGHIILHGDTILFVSIFSYAKSYQSFNSLYSEIHFYNKETISRNIRSKYNDFFQVSIYLLKYLSELKYNSQKMFNLHIQLGVRMVFWALNVVGLNKLILNWDLFNKTIKEILNNKDLNQPKKQDIRRISNLVKLKSNRH